MTIRPAAQDDLDLLWEFLTLAAYEPDVAAAKAVPFVAGHLAGWRRPSDFGLVAELDGLPVGAAWARHIPAADNPFYIDDRSPVVTIAVRDGARGKGVGGILMRALIAEAAARGLQLSLDVRETNPAMRLYERLGFRRVPGQEVRNRVGTLSLGMVLDPPASGRSC
jgi:ribosomal protein S18 acetylase RimI-like enzyme